MRAGIEVTARVTNLDEMKTGGAGDVRYAWDVSRLAVTKEIAPGKLLLTRAQNSGKLTITATVDNGGTPITRTAEIAVTEPKIDPWTVREPAKDEKPVDGQFYARDDKDEGALYYNGTFAGDADSVFLKVFVDDRSYAEHSAKLGADRAYAFAVKLKPGLVKYRVEFGTGTGAAAKVLHAVGNLVCGDVYIIQGQSNALATDTHEDAPPDTSEWIRSYGKPMPGDAKAPPANLWCYPVWRARHGERAELGYWGMELAKRLVDGQKMPVCIFNGAVGGTRIDQHQPNPADPEDPATIYGRLLWRVRQARLTHGVRGILWHQGESDQGADGPTGGFGWQTYQRLFVELSGAWMRDFPNVRHYYVFQIWPKSCSMGVDGSDNVLREVQRTLPELYSNMSVMSTLGIRPAGGCHYPLVGWAEFARLIYPLIERDNYGKTFAEPITPPNLVRARYVGDRRDEVALEFDQPVVWNDALAGQFYLDGAKGLVISGRVAGNTVVLKLTAPTMAKTVAYLDSKAWSQDTLLVGTNGIAALTFHGAPILPPKP